MGGHAERMRAQERGRNGQQSIKEYERGWAKFMVDIWHEKMAQLGTVDTGRLQQSLQYAVSDGPVTTIEHKFMQYGLYVAQGVTPAFRWKYWGGNIPKGGSKSPRERIGNGGQLEFLDKTYRQEHGLDEPKKVGPSWGGRVAGGTPKGKRDWFFKKYYYSIRRLNLAEAEFYGRAYQGLISTFLDELFSGTIRSNRF